MGFLFFWGIGRVPLAQAVALAFIAPLIALYLASVLLKEEIGPRTIGGSLIAFAGVLVIFYRPGPGRPRPRSADRQLRDPGLGDALRAQHHHHAAPGAGRRAARDHFFPERDRDDHPRRLSIPLCRDRICPPPPDWPWILFAAVLAVTSMLLLSWAYARAEANYLATTEYTAFLWAILFGWLFFDEHVSPFTLVGRDADRRRLHPCRAQAGGREPGTGGGDLMAWFYLILGGLFEVGFTTSLRFVDGFRNVPWTIAFLVSVAISMGLLELAARTIPMGTAYAVWGGIGAVGTVLVGIAFFNEPSSADPDPADLRHRRRDRRAEAYRLSVHCGQRRRDLRAFLDRPQEARARERRRAPAHRHSRATASAHRSTSGPMKLKPTGRPLTRPIGTVRCG